MASAERETITGSGGEAPLKLNAFLFLGVQRKLQICPIIDTAKVRKLHSE